MTLDLIKEKGYTPTNPVPVRHALNVTVPGAAAGWVDTIEKFGSGKVSPKQIKYTEFRNHRISLNWWGWGH